MFVRDFIHVAQPFESVAPCFVTDPGWLASIAEGAARDARDLSAAVLPEDGTGGNGRTPSSVHCDTGPVRVRRDSLIVPLRVAADGPELPPLDADLEVSPLGPARCQLTLSATYRRATGSATDDALAERMAEAAVRIFLQAVADRIAAGDTDA
jgi:hypothetical protein